MNKTIRILLAAAVVLIAGGVMSYYHGDYLNGQAPVDEESLLQLSSADKWLYIGGLSMMLGGALFIGALKFWIHQRRKPVAGIFEEGLSEI